MAGVTCALLGQGQAPKPHGYRTNPRAVEKLGEELLLAAKSRDRKRLCRPPVVVQTNAVPYVRLTGPVQRDQPLGPLVVSSGLVEWINRVAHAKAIDSRQPGYFSNYFASLAQGGRAMTLAELPDRQRPAYWSDEVMKEQQALSVSLHGYVIATHLAYYFLDYYPALAWKLNGYPGPPVWAHSQLSAEQWSKVFQTGARLNLETGYPNDGIRMSVAGLQPLGKRPEWAACFVSPLAGLKRQARDIERLEAFIDSFD